MPNPRIRTGHSKYQEDDKRIQVFIIVEIGSELDQDRADDADLFPFHLRVELGAEFEVDEDHFPKGKVGEWASVNAPFILFPYIREQVYSLTARCGFPPVLLPLLEVPTIKIQKTES
jgi:preprotein translocase subunit SecB